jgi:hypothetical protein
VVLSADHVTHLEDLRHRAALSDRRDAGGAA